MGLIQLTGIDLNDPTPGVKRELAPNRGAAGGATQSRKAAILCNKISSVGSGSVDGRGDALDQPIAIAGGESEVIERFGNHSEALLLYKTFVDHNKSTEVSLVCVAPGTTTATCDFTFATAASVNGVVRVSFIGETTEVAVAAGDSVTTVAALVRDAINAKYHWPLVASANVGVLTTAASWAGVRGTHYVNKLRIAFVQTNAMTITKGSVTSGATEDDQTNAILALETFDHYYHVNPKPITSAPTSTDNGIGEHLAALVDWVAPTKGKQGVLIAGNVGTPSQATTVAVGMNQPWAFLVHQENSDWSAGMIAAMFAAILANAELSDRAPNLAGYGGGSSDVLKVPAPFASADRPTATEIKTLLNNGVTPIAFVGNKPYVVWYVTTKSQTNSQTDYRARPGHVPSILFDFWETLAIEYASIKQAKVANDPVDGEKPLPGFTYPKDVRSLISSVIDLKIDSQPATLDPSQRQAMKDSILVERLTSGIAARASLAAVRHNLKGHFLIEEVSPSI